MNEYISKINELYITNRKKYLIMFPNGKYMTVDKETKDKKRKSLVDSDIEEHLKGEKTFGVFAGETFSKFICFDVDVEDTYKAKWHTYRIIHTLVQIGFPIDRIYPSLSGNKGYHIELFFQEVVPNKKLIELFNIVMETAGYNKVEEYTYECDGGKIELRPVANRLGVKLPLGKHFKTPNNKRCWYVDVYTLKEIRSKKFILEIKQIDNKILDNIFDTFIDLTEEDNFYKFTTIEREITELKTRIKEQYKPLKEYKLNNDELYTLESIRKLEKEGLKQVGTRHISLFKLARLYKYEGYSKDENESKLLNWMKQQDKNNYRTKWEACVQDIKNIVDYVYEKDITLTVPNREIIIYKEELIEILKLPKKCQKLIAFAMLVHSKRFAQANGVFYMTQKQMAEATGYSERQIRRELPTLEEYGIFSYYSKNVMITNDKGQFQGKKPNKYKMNILFNDTYDNAEAESYTIDICNHEQYKDLFNKSIVNLFDLGYLKKVLPRRHYDELRKYNLAS
jgi:hypothetical protein